MSDRSAYDLAVLMSATAKQGVDVQKLDGPCPGCGSGDQVELYYTDGEACAGHMFHNVDCIEQWREMSATSRRG